MNDERYKFWMVWREGTPTTRHRHHSKKNAEAEAERMAQGSPGETFFVLKAVGALQAQKPPVKRLKLTQDHIPF